MSQKEDLESRIKEQRLAEATKKGLTGQAGKIGTVLRFLGSPIIAQSEATIFLDTQGTGEETNEIPTMEVEGATRPEGSEWSDADVVQTPFNIRPIGFHFDGLSRGMHLEILYKEDVSEMIVYYKGVCVFREIQGDLVGYVPNDEWEGWISSLFKVAKKIQREEKEKEFQEKVKDAERARSSWLSELASRWGFSHE